MPGTYAHNWAPRNLGGEIYYDPRRELEYWADSVPDGQTMVAVPVATLRAAAAVRECGNEHVMTHDEDGPLQHSVVTRCRLPEGHDKHVRPNYRPMHFNGYVNWS